MVTNARHAEEQRGGSGGVHADFDAVQHGIAGQRVDVGEDDVVGARAGVRAGALQAGVVEAVPVTVRQADHAGTHLVVDLEWYHDGAGCRSQRDAAAVGEPARRGIARVHAQGAAFGPLDQRGQVVHPRVVGMELAAPDEQQPVAGGRVREFSGGGGEFAVDGGVGQRQAAVARAQPAGQLRLHRPEIDAVRRRAQARELEAVDIVGEAVAERTRAHQKIEHAIAGILAVDTGEDVVDGSPGDG